MTNSSTVLVTVASKTRAKLTNDPVRGLGQSAEARRVRDLYRSYLVALGSPVDAATQAMIIATSEQVVIAENARRDHLAGKADLDAVIRAENMSARALRRLGLNKPATAPRLSYVEKIEAKEAAQRAAQGRTESGADGGTTPADDRNECAGAAGAQAGEVVV